MAAQVWGIDIGQSAIKALRGRLADDGQSVIATGYDYVEYPQLLSQPDANPEQLIQEALKTFLSRNSLRGEKVAISLPGQSGLARFIKLPPVDSKQLPNLVGFEAKQQIPFALEDVVWDYQRLSAEPSSAKAAKGGKSAEEDDDEDDDELEDDEDDELDTLETEVGLFAIKRDQVLRAIRPLVDADVEIDFIQLAPICIFNAIAYDQLHSDTTADPKSNDWIAVLSMGTDTSDLVLTNGARVWQRSVPIGGSHFTKQLTKDLKLTFAKAEQLKQNAREAKDAKQIFQAMRSVFSDLVTEVQRSIGYFGTLQREAEISRMLVVGNAVKLPGLPQYLEKNLGLPVTKIESFQRLAGAGVTDDNRFEENILSYPVCYGLVLQGLAKSKLRTNLVPPEIVRARIIRRKKPWAAAIAASLLLACAFNFFFNYNAWYEVNEEREVNNVSWSSAKSRLDTVKSTYTTLKSSDEEKVRQLEVLEELGEEAVGSDDGRKLWLELLKTITDCLPTDPENQNSLKSPLEHPLEKRPDIYIDSIESEFFPDLSTWASPAVTEKYDEFLAERRQDLMEEQAARRAAAEGEAEDGGEPGAAMEDVPVDEVADDTAAEGAPAVEGPGWVIELKGHHFKRSGNLKDARYVRKRLLDTLDNGTVRLPVGNDGEMEEFQVKEMGIIMPVMISHGADYHKIPNLEYQPPRESPMAGGLPGMPPGLPTRGDAKKKDDPNNPANFEAESYRFTVQFAWKQIPSKVRLKERKLAEQTSTGEEGEL